MFTSALYVILVASPILTDVVKNESDSCSADEFSCHDGTCVTIGQSCNGINDCTDGSDELGCGIGSINATSDDTTLHRSRRQASTCRKNEFKCRDNTCISFDGKCDGVVDCADGSDETHALCRKNQCQYNWFRCTYGACVDGSAPCNGIQECADNSDELLPKCRNETKDVRGQFKCLDGSTIPAANHCDGVRDCADGSDETVRACAAKTCPAHLFQCAYGACVDSGADCNQIQECADGSDEAADLCDRSLPGTTAKPPVVRPPTGGCVLPPYPTHGTYVVTNYPSAKPGEAYDLVTVNVTCRPGYGVDGSNTVFCQSGWWQESLPKCVSLCKLNPHPSVEYRCIVASGTVQGIRDCNEYEPSGTRVYPQCRSPNYYSATTLTLMRCIDGSWDYIARCTPECGRVTPEGEQLVIGGALAKRGEIPWHAGIYKKNTNPYMQVCGGSLISNKIVLSAAHCFWTDLEKQLPTATFAVAVGKLYRPWNNQMEEGQQSDVKEIHLPDRFLGSEANFQSDIAVVIVATAFVYKTYVRPVCVDFDTQFDKQQLQTGRMGKVAGWGLTAEDGKASQVLKVIEIPYVAIQECIAGSPPGFREYITSDKICAGYKESGSALCKGDSGGGLAFPESEKGIERYYLRGIVSTAPNNEHLCNANTYTSFTQLLSHEHFIKEFWAES